MNNADTLTDTIDALHGVDHLLRWAEADAWWPTNADRPPPRLPDHIDPAHDTYRPPPPPDDPDQVPGDTYNLAIGNHAARTAWHTAAGHLQRTDGYMALAAIACAPTDQPRTPPPPATHAQAVHLIRLTTTRSRYVRQRLTTARQPGPLRLRIRQAHDEAQHAWRTLTRAFQVGPADPDTQATSDRCVVCGWRPREAKKGNRCHTCYSWKQRHGYERPTNLDGHQAARAAQARRLARGEGWGSA